MSHLLPLYTICTNVQKAFDTVWRKAILQKLYKHFKAPLSLIKLIQNLLSETCSGLQTSFYIDKIFSTKNGVVQEGVLSSFLYCVFINDLIDELEKPKQGIRILQITIPALLYCDDIILLASNDAQ